MVRVIFLSHLKKLMDDATIFSKVLEAQIQHTRFLNATQKYITYYYYGKDISLVEDKVFPEIDVINLLESYSADPQNPLQYVVKQFMDEIVASDFSTSVEAFPVPNKEPYASYADNLEDYLIDIHRGSKRSSQLRMGVFELLIHGYFGIYSNGRKYWFLTPYDFIPGDPKTFEIQNQPFIIRKTKVSESYMKMMGIDIDNLNPLKSGVADNDKKIGARQYGLYDVWIKDLDKNICFTDNGKVAYQQNFPNPKRYPFFIGRSSELLNSFYPIPVMSQLVEILKVHQTTKDNVVESAKSIGNPLLVHDTDAGIDENKLLMALKKGYKRIIIGKNSEGDIDFKAPGSLPVYAQKLPEIEEQKMSQYLGINPSFFGQTGAARERGAISRLQQSSFRSLKAVAQILNDTFTDVDSYLLDFLQHHQIRMTEDLKLQNLEQIFNPGKIKYVPKEELQSFSLQDTRENKVFSLAKWKSKLIPQKLSLIEQGYTQPRRIIKQARAEQEEMLAMAQKMKAPPIPERSLLDQVDERLKGQLEFEYWLSPIARDKILVKVNFKDTKKASFLLSDLTNSVLLQQTEDAERPPQEQRSLEPKPQPVPGQILGEDPNSLASKLASVGGLAKEPPSVLPETEETRGRPTPKVLTSEELAEKELSTPTVKEVGEEEKTPSSKPIVEAKVVSPSSSVFNESDLEEMVKAKKIIGKIASKNYLKLPGLYVVEPHAKWIDDGKKLLLILSKKFDILNKSFLLCGKSVYGVITIKKIVEDFDFNALEKYHLVTPAQKLKWWKNALLYLYVFKYDSFEKSLSYVRTPGVQTFIEKVQITEGAPGVPQEGDLKPQVLKPKDIPPSHNSEKKTFQSSEVSSTKRLEEIVPKSTYDVSERMNGLRCFGWIVDGKALLYSDKGDDFKGSWVVSILEMLVSKFRHNVLLDGEIIMEGMKREDIISHINSGKTPTPEQLKSLRYIVWDILYVKDKSIASLPFSKRSSILDLYLQSKEKDSRMVKRVYHKVGPRIQVPKLMKMMSSSEGIVVRDINASYWATHSTYEFKNNN